MLGPGSRADAVDAVATEAIEALLDLPGVARVGLALTEGGGRRLQFTASDRERAETVDWCHIDAYDDVPLTTVTRTGRPVLGALDDLDPRYERLVERQRRSGVRALAALPLTDGGPPLGGVVLFYGLPQPFDDEQRADLDRRATRLAAELRRVQAAGPRSGPALADVEVPPGVLVCDLEVPPEPRAVGEARRFLRRQLAAWQVDDEVADDALLCLSELVTNAVLHTAAPSEVRGTLEDGVLTVVVRDAGAIGRPAPVGDAVDPLRVHGRGLTLVDELADRWGSELDATGTTVWFVLEVARSPVSATA